MNQPLNLEDDNKRLIALIEEMDGQTDRGVAIVGAAWIEEAMTTAIQSFLHDDSKAWKRLFSGNGALASFSSKIDLAILLGLVSDAIRSDLHIIREIRNEFAHQITHKTQHTKLGFSSAHIKDKCMFLKCIAHENIDDPRVAFVRACATLNSDFEIHKMFGYKVSDGDHIFAKIDSSR